MEWELEEEEEAWKWRKRKVVVSRFKNVDVTFMKKKMLDGFWNGRKGGGIKLCFKWITSFAAAGICVSFSRCFFFSNASLLNLRTKRKLWKTWKT